jgi:signal peptidase I
VILFSKHRSYTEKLLAARKKRKVLARILGVVLVIGFFHTFLIRSFIVSTDSMLPSLARGDVIISSPLLSGASTWFGRLPPMVSYARGDVIAVFPDATAETSFIFKIWDSLVRFFTVQKISPRTIRYGSDVTKPDIFRIVGLPGDTVRKKGRFFEILPSGRNVFIAEYASSEKSYSIQNEPTLQSDSNDVVLGDSMYFVASDDRSHFTGSIAWGPTPASRMGVKILAVIWPFNHFKLL